MIYIEIKRIHFRASTTLIREIDESWVKSGFILNRSHGIRWLIKKGIEKVKEDGM